MDTVKAGDSYQGQCPSGQRSELRVGDKLPSPAKAMAKVLKVDGAQYVLGPLRAGQIVLSVPCEGSGLQDISFVVEELPPEAAANRYKPLGTEAVAYPNTLYLLILIILLIPIAGSLIYFFRKRKVRVASAPGAKAKMDPRQLLEKDLTYYEQNVTNPESHHFHQMYKRLRKFIEKELALKTRSLTTQEFLGTFRALALQQSTNQTLIAQLEYILRTTDDVRFAGKVFTPALWQDYLQRVRAIIAAFPKNPTGGKK